MNIRQTILLAALISICVGMRAQVTMNFLPSIHGQRIDGLYFVRLMNTSGAPWAGTLKIVVHDNDGREIVQITTPRFILQPGASQVDKNTFSKSIIKFSGGYAASILQQTGRFPEGDVEYCFEFIGEIKQGGDNNIFQNCFEHFIQPLTPLSLIYPSDGDAICITRPAFLWQPPLPTTPQTRFRIIVVETASEEVAAQSLTNNLPVVNQAGIPGNTILYPGASPDLQQGKKYAWQVVAYQGKAIVSKSEIWTFSIKCDTPKVVTQSDSYRELKDVAENNHYISQGLVRFAFTNPYRAGDLDYAIVDLRDPNQKFSKLPKVKVNTGFNKIDLDVSKLKLKDGAQYLLKVRRNGNRWLFMRFIYNEPIGE